MTSTSAELRRKPDSGGEAPGAAGGLSWVGTGLLLVCTWLLGQMRDGWRRRQPKSGLSAWVAHLIIKLIKASIWQCHSCTEERGENGGGRKKGEFKYCGLRGPHVKGCFSSRAACAGLHGHWVSGGREGWRDGRRLVRKENTAFKSKWQEGAGVWCWKHRSRKGMHIRTSGRGIKKDGEGELETADIKGPSQAAQSCTKMGATARQSAGFKESL